MPPNTTINNRSIRNACIFFIMDFLLFVQNILFNLNNSINLDGLAIKQNLE